MRSSVIYGRRIKSSLGCPVSDILSQYLHQEDAYEYGSGRGSIND